MTAKETATLIQQLKQRRWSPESILNLLLTLAKPKK